MTPEELFKKTCQYYRSHNKDEYLRNTFGHLWFKENTNVGVYILDKCFFDFYNNFWKYKFGDRLEILDSTYTKQFRFIDLKKDYNELDLYYFMLNGFEN